MDLVALGAINTTLSTSVKTFIFRQSIAPAGVRDGFENAIYPGGHHGKRRMSGHGTDVRHDIYGWGRDANPWASRFIRRPDIPRVLSNRYATWFSRISLPGVSVTRPITAASR